MAKKIAQVFGVIFLLVGLLGFIGNPIVGEMGLFHADMMHNLVHILSGLILLIAASKGAAALWLKVIGIVYLLVAILGFMMLGEDGMGSVLGIVSVNGADNWLHLVLAAILLWGGFAGKSGGAPMASPGNMGGMPGQM